MLKERNFLTILKKLIKENNERFQVAFAEPYDEDVVNRIIFDLYQKKIISRKEIYELKLFYSKENFA